MRADDRLFFRYWDFTDGLGESYVSNLSVDASGSIWVNHGDVTRMSWFDGYHIHNIKSPGSDVKVYHSLSGQIWSISQEGLLEYKNEEWILHRVDDSCRSRFYGFSIASFYPIQEDRILYLLPTKLMEYDAGRKQAKILLPVRNTKLGRFRHFCLAKDGGLWITGEKGIAKIHPKDGRLSSGI